MGHAEDQQARSHAPPDRGLPSYHETWNTYVNDESYDPDLVYLHVGEFARHLVRLRKAATVEELPAVFAVVERLHVEGDDYVKECATIGLLEDLQNMSNHAGLWPDNFFPTWVRSRRGGGAKSSASGQARFRLSAPR